MLKEHDYNEYCRGMGIINSADLADRRFDRIDWLAEDLLKPGLSILAGAPKIGKSWLVLQLCLAVAKGEPFLGNPTRQGSVLYISLEDSETRLQERINRITEKASVNLHVALHCSTLGDELSMEIADFTVKFPDARLVVIDTFQKIREQSAQMSYSGDYSDVSFIKHVADQLGITILLVHHTRKMSDGDVINEISGTNGIAGSADTLMILKKQKRTDSKAILSCTGRDIEDRVTELDMDRETCIWKAVSAPVKKKKEAMPPILHKLIAYAAEIKTYDGSNAAFCAQFCAYSGEDIAPNALKRIMNRWRYALEDAGLYYLSVRTKNERRLAVNYYQPDKPLLDPVSAEEEAALWEEAALRKKAGRGAEEIPLPTNDDAPSADRDAEPEEIPLPTDDDAPPADRDRPWQYFH